MSEFKTKKLVFTVHGIRTFGQWQQRLEKLVAADPEASGCDWDFKHKDYKFFSVFRFINPLTRWIEVRRFRNEFLDKVEDAKADRIYLVGHSFGTHIIANALRGIEPSKRPKIHLIITSGSVLSEWFPWSRSFDDSVARVVNDCGTRDGILALNAFLPLNSGLAGRFGFAGITDNTLTNRYSDSAIAVISKNPNCASRSMIVTGSCANIGFPCSSRTRKWKVPTNARMEF